LPNFPKIILQIRDNLFRNAILTQRYFRARLIVIMVYDKNEILIALFIATSIGDGGGEMMASCPFSFSSKTGLGTLKMFDNKKYTNRTMTTLRYLIAGYLVFLSMKASTGDGLFGCR